MEAKIDASHVKVIASQERTIAKMDAWLAEMKDSREEPTAWQEATEAYPEKLEANSEDMESEAEHREVPKEHTGVETGRAPNKRHWGRHPTTERRQEPKERIGGNCGSRNKLAAGRRMTHRAGEATREGRCCTEKPPKGRTFGKRWKGPKCKIGIKDPGTRRQLHLKTIRQPGASTGEL